MGKVKYVYNPRTLKYEVAKNSWSRKLLRVFLFLSIILISSFLLHQVYDRILPDSEKQAMEVQIKQMELESEMLITRLSDLGKVLDNIKDRDNQVYRTLFGMEPLDNHMWNGGVGGHDPLYEAIFNESSSEAIKALDKELDKLERKAVIQSRSLERTEGLAIEKKREIAATPSIKPVRADKLHRDMELLSGFGMRKHPIHNQVRMHKGIDFACETGTPVQATADGKISEVNKSRSGYGINIMIDHGFGYQTLYAHLSGVDVKVGQQVKKGQKIGAVGNTGTSTAPHLHYEVYKDGVVVNPIHYCYDGFTAEEYQQLVKNASRFNQSFD